MLPGVELARRRRVHYRGDVALLAGAAEHHYYAHAHHAAPAAPTGVAGPALAARIRLEEKLRGAALPSTSTSPSRSVASCLSLPPSLLYFLPCFAYARFDASVGKTSDLFKRRGT
jgi:hypothetical protein